MPGQEPLVLPLPKGAVAEIERATLAAVAPSRLEALGEWLLPMDHGTVGRAHSAVPLSHRAELADPALIDPILARYRVQGFAPVFRLPVWPLPTGADTWAAHAAPPQALAWGRFAAALTERGFLRQQTIFTQCGPLAGLLALPVGWAADRRGPRPDPVAGAALGTGAAPCLGPRVALSERPDADWLAMYLGEGLDPVDGASRAQALARAEGLVYASLRLHPAGPVLACGAASWGQAWLGVHGMRTAAAQRGQGWAGQLLRAMAEEAQRRGLGRVFLQVEANNAAALALYHRAGLQTAWAYAYWRRGPV